MTECKRCGKLFDRVQLTKVEGDMARSPVAFPKGPAGWRKVGVDRWAMHPTTTLVCRICLDLPPEPIKVGNPKMVAAAGFKRYQPVQRA